MADIADTDAKYANDADKEDFQEHIGNKQPKKKSEYKWICWQHPLRGEPVAGTPARFLTRCKTLEALEYYQREAIFQTSDIDRRNHPSQRYPELSIPDSGSWNRAREAFDVAPEFGDNEFYVAYVAGRPEEKAVFATPQDGDNSAPVDGHTPRFYQTVQEDRRIGETEADCAVYRLALAEHANRAADFVLIYYPRTNLDDASCLYPVPPDAGFTPQFKPVHTDSNSAFGRTCPGDFPDCDEVRDEAELVHPNVPLSMTDVWVCLLDNEDEKTN
jgi:hypothetical protein